MTLTITPEVEALLQNELQRGRFQDPNELIATALQVFFGSRPDHSVDLERMIDEGIASADRGEVYDEAAARAFLRSSRSQL